MALEQKLNLRLSQRLVMTPSLQQAIKLLQMSKLELQDVLTQEIVENPLLEEEEEAAAAEQPTEAEAEAEASAPKESDAEAPPAAPDVAETPVEKERDSFDEIDFDSYFEDYLDSAYNPRQYEDTEQVPLENTLSRPQGLPEHLNWQLSMSDSPVAVREIAQYLIGNIDEDGYLRVSREEIRAAGFTDDGNVEAALALVRSFDPPGVGAFDLPDCLLLQIRALGIENLLIDKVIGEHWAEFLNRQFAQLARSLNVGLSQLQAVFEIIKNLEPKPGRKYSDERTIYVEPDVAVRKIGDEYVIQLNEDGLPKLRISAAYRRMLRGGNGAIGESRDVPEREDALGGLAHQEPGSATADDLQGRRLDRSPPAGVPRERHRAPAAARSARRRERHRDARVDGVARRLEQVHPHAARALSDEVLLPQRHRLDSGQRGLVAFHQEQDREDRLGRGRRPAPLRRTDHAKAPRRGDPDRPAHRREISRRAAHPLLVATQTEFLIRPESGSHGGLMAVEWTGRNVEVTPSLMNLARERAERLERHLGGPAKVRVVLSHERHRFSAEIIATHRRRRWNAHEYTDDARAARSAGSSGPAGSLSSR